MNLLFSTVDFKILYPSDDTSFLLYIFDFKDLSFWWSVLLFF